MRVGLDLNWTAPQMADGNGSKDQPLWRSMVFEFQGKRGIDKAHDPFGQVNKVTKPITCCFLGCFEG